MQETDYLKVLGRLVYHKRIGNSPAERSTFRAISAETGVSIATLHRVESGSNAPDLGTFRRLCLWLGVSADEVLGLRQERRADRDRPQDTPA